MVDDAGYSPQFVLGRHVNIAIGVSAISSAFVAATQLIGVGAEYLGVVVWAFLISSLVAQTWFGVALYGASRNLEFFTGQSRHSLFWATIYVGAFVAILGTIMLRMLIPYMATVTWTRIVPFATSLFVGGLCVAWLIAPFFVHRVHRDSLALTDQSWSKKTWSGAVRWYYAFLFTANIVIPTMANRDGFNPLVPSLFFVILADLTLQRVVNDIVISQELAASARGVGVLAVEPLMLGRKINPQLRRLGWGFVIASIVALFIWVNLQEALRIWHRIPR
jgi:hypothetical protein